MRTIISSWPEFEMTCAWSLSAIALAIEVPVRSRGSTMIAALLLSRVGGGEACVGWSKEQAIVELLLTCWTFSKLRFRSALLRWPKQTAGTPAALRIKSASARERAKAEVVTPPATTNEVSRNLCHVIFFSYLVFHL